MKQAKKTQLPTPMMGPPRAVLGPPNTKPPIGQHSRPAAARNRSGGRVHFMATERYQALAPSQTDPLPTIVLGISEGSVALTVLPSIALFFAVCGVVMWARQEQNRQD
jgi:hypothetical protein